MMTLGKYALRTLGLAFALALWTTAAPLQADDKADDLKALQGTWTSEQGIESRWVFEDDNLKATVGDHNHQCKITLDPKAKPFPTIDLKITGGAADSLGKLSKGIYKFDGKALTLCVSMPGGETRPTKFETVEDEFYNFELKKEK